nr:MAG TPA: hypothetical protein [Caudoviricetes sp.]
MLLELSSCILSKCSINISIPLKYPSTVDGKIIISLFLTFLTILIPPLSLIQFIICN